MTRIVVGVDGSTGALGALHWAFEEAALRDAAVMAVMAYSVPVVVTAPETLWAMPISEEEIAGHAGKALQAAIAKVRALHPDVEVVEVVKAGPPAKVLASLAKTADLLVVGSRGLGGFKGLVLGSVSTQCVHHSSCPVVVVPGPTTDVED